MRWGLIWILSVLEISFAGCASFHSRIDQPTQLKGTYADALQHLRDTHNQLARRVYSQEFIAGTTNLTTLGGFGGAGVAAVFKGSRDLILGLVSLGSVSSVVNGLYAYPAQQTIYSNGLDAIACIENAFSPLTAAQTGLDGALHDLAVARGSVENYRPPAAIGATQTQDEAVALAAADAAVTGAHQWQRDLDKKASPVLNGALMSVIATIDSQLRTATPDALAFARAASGLQTSIIGNVPQGAAPAAHGTPESAEVVSETPDPVLTARISGLKLATKGVTDLTSASAESPSVSCKVADATPVAPVAVVIPNGGSEIDIAPGAFASYQITGGTPPYGKVVWSPTEPLCFTAVILSPSTLQITGKPSCTADTGKDPFTFDVYDVANHHLPKMIGLKVNAPAGH